VDGEFRAVRNSPDLSVIQPALVIVMVLPPQPLRAVLRVHHEVGQLLPLAAVSGGLAQSVTQIHAQIGIPRAVGHCRSNIGHRIRIAANQIGADAMANVTSAMTYRAWNA